jgi:DNA repair protein RadC
MEIAEEIAVRVPDPNFDRPRERLMRRGAAGIADDELLAIVLGTGARRRSALALAADLVRAAGGLAALSRASPRELVQLAGVGAARAATVVAAFELGRRAVENVQYRDEIGRPEDVFRCVGPRLSGLQQELFLAIGIDIRNRLLEIVEIARGSLSGVEVHPREVFRPLVRMAAAGAVLVHNHPSGDPTPSSEDLDLTRRLREVGALLGIPIVDHVVIGDGTFRSVNEWAGVDL